MFRFTVQRFYKAHKYRYLTTKVPDTPTKVELPESADVVVIGGGSAGCNALYHLGKNGINAILLEKSKLISGTTWHTAGLVWSVRGPNDVEIELLKSSRRVLGSLEKETGIDPGWISNGGLNIAHTKERLDEYKRLVTASKAFGVETSIITPAEAKKLFPLLDEKAFIGALYSPADGAVDPAMLINALTKSARSNGCKIFEDCPVTKLVTEKTNNGNDKIVGVGTPHGIIRTNIVLNASGAWSPNISKMKELKIPLIPMKHAYVVTEPIKGLEKVPNVRDPDINLYFRIRGGSMSIGGYEENPIILNTAPENFSFSLYELDWDVFNAHMESMVQLIPVLSKTGVKSTVCGPESFTPDHRPILGEDPRCFGLFYSCGYNSAGMMLGGGFGEEIVNWIIQGRPNKHMFTYDIRRYIDTFYEDLPPKFSYRFIPEQRNNSVWAKERSHEAYAKNYSIAFPRDEPLSGRNVKTDSFHDLLIAEGAFMEERQGWERPGWFYPGKNLSVATYDYGGHYDNEKNAKDEYRDVLKKEYSFEFSPHDVIIREEALACRNNVALFDMSYFGKFYLCGEGAQDAADYLCTSKTNNGPNKTVYTCMLNGNGGVESDCTVTSLEPGSSGLVDPIFKDNALYIVAGGMSSYHTYSHMRQIIDEKGFNVSLHDVTERIGMLAVQGRNSRKVLETIVDGDISEKGLKFSNTKVVKIQNEMVRVIRLSYVGELGFELHIPEASCEKVYAAIMKAGKEHGMKLAGYRAMYSLSCEKGFHLWGSDLRLDDNPIEAGLGFTCRKIGDYLGKESIDRVRNNGTSKRLVHFQLPSNVPMWGLEAIYRNNAVVGYIRRAEVGYTNGNVIARGYVQDPSGQPVTKEFLKAGSYEIEIMGKRHPAEFYLNSPFDHEGKRLLGVYEK